MASISSKAVRVLPQQERSERRLAAFLDAAAALFAEVGYEAATMTEIAERSGSSIGALYNYFPDKQSIAFTLAITAHRARWMVTPVTLLGSLLYTIPSLAAFEILVSITGINWYTVEIALVSYTLLILFTNTLAGLSAVSPEVLDAAHGIGLTPRQTLWRIELPLALPTIIAGLRVAVVTIISLATVAAYIVPAGLGKPIFDAISSGGFNTKFVAAGGLCIALALVADAVFAVLQRLLTPWAATRRVG